METLDIFNIALMSMGVRETPVNVMVVVAQSVESPSLDAQLSIVASAKDSLNEMSCVVINRY